MNLLICKKPKLSKRVVSDFPSIENEGIEIFLPDIAFEMGFDVDFISTILPWHAWFKLETSSCC